MSGLDSFQANDDYNVNHHNSPETVESVLIIIGIIAGVILLLILIRLFIQGPTYRKKNRIDGKIVIITGCNTGIGKETALELAKRGAKVYMACRDMGKCEAARLEIIKKSKNQNVFNRQMDLSSLESIRKFAEQFLSEESKLDILINNAGIMATPKGYTKDGFEQQIGVNHFGHFYLVNLLLDTLKASSPSRIIVVSSAVYIAGKIKKDDINSEKTYSPVSAYTQSKLANILFTKYLSKKLDGTGVTVNSLHPGAVNTELTRYMMSPLARTLCAPITYYFFKTPKAGAQTTIRLALDPAMETTSGNCYFDTYFRFPILFSAKDPELAEWLWKTSENMIREKLQNNSTSTSLQNDNSSTTLTTVFDLSNESNNEQITNNTTN